MSISIDHTDFLGDTIEKIAMEKSGIIKKNCPVVLYSQAELVYNIIKDAAARMDACLLYTSASNCLNFLFYTAIYNRLSLIHI